MIKTHISALLVVLLAGAQMVQAQESMDDIFAQLDAANGTGGSSTTTAPAAPAEVNDVAPATVEAAPAAAPVQKEEAVEAKADAKADAKTNVIDSLFDKGISLYKKDDLAGALNMFDAILALDQYNVRAANYKKRVAQRIASREAVKRDASRTEAFSDVEAAWSPESKVLVNIDETQDDSVADADDQAVQQMEAQLKEIQIPSLDFPDASINDVLDFLRVAAGSKVNILLMGMDPSAADASAISLSIQNVNLYEALGYVVQMASLKFEVKPNAVYVMPADYVPVADMVSKSYDISPTVGTDLAASANSDGDSADDLFGDSSASSDTSSGPIDVTAFFKGEVDFPKGSSAIYRARFNKLSIKNTPENIKKVEEVLTSLEDKAMNELSQQVEIEAKFIEFNEGALEELGFDWTVYGSGTVAGFGMKDGTHFQPASGYRNPIKNADGNYLTTPSPIYTDPVSGAQVIQPVEGRGGQSLFGTAQRNNGSVFSAIKTGVLSTMGGSPAAMVFGNGDVDLRITAMEQEGTADVLSAPRVTTKSGSEAVIRVAETHRYPQDYDVETGQRTAPIVKPQDWEDFDLGVTLKVTPVVNPESDTIDLDLLPQITKFRGYDDYVVGFNAYETGEKDSVVKGDGSPLLARMPYFERRSVQTQVTIADGHTVVMGGLVDEFTETFRDQVPFLGDIPYLGRLFRTEGSRTSKRNLVISVKATQVDARGMTRAEREMQRN